MKRPLFSLLFLLSVCFYCTTSTAQNPNYQELVLGFPTITPKTFPLIKSVLKGINGVQLVAYCDDLKIFLLKYNSNLIQSEGVIIAALENAPNNFKTEIKVGSTISQLIQNCTIFPVASTIDERE
jgi:hypothetical protein